MCLCLFANLVGSVVLTTPTLTNYKMCLPKKFLCRYPLSIGAVASGSITLCLLIICAVLMIVQIVFIKDCACDSCKPFALRNCNAYSITGLIYILIMIAANSWFFHGIKAKKPSVVLSWFVVYLIWLVLIFVILIVLICLYISDTHDFTKAICVLVFGFVAIAILVYGILLVAAFWLELKRTKKQAPETHT